MWSRIENQWHKRLLIRLNECSKSSIRRPVLFEWYYRSNQLEWQLRESCDRAEWNSYVDWSNRMTMNRMQLSNLNKFLWQIYWRSRWLFCFYLDHWTISISNRSIENSDKNLDNMFCFPVDFVRYVTFVVHPALSVMKKSSSALWDAKEKR